MASPTLNELYKEVKAVRDASMLNETERRNELMALDLLFRAGYYKGEP